MGKAAIILRQTCCNAVGSRTTSHVLGPKVNSRSSHKNIIDLRTVDGHLAQMILRKPSLKQLVKIHGGITSALQITFTGIGTNMYTINEE